MEENYAVCDEVLGDVRISGEVVANIAVSAAGEIEGVAYVLGEGKPNELKNIVGIRNHSKDLRVEVCDRIVSVDMAIAVKYGFSLPKVGKAVQERVRTSIENMTGLDVSDINVRIASVDLK